MEWAGSILDPAHLLDSGYLLAVVFQLSNSLCNTTRSHERIMVLDVFSCYDNFPVDMIINKKNVVDIKNYYNCKRLRSYTTQPTIVGCDPNRPHS